MFAIEILQSITMTERFFTRNVHFHHLGRKSAIQCIKIMITTYIFVWHQINKGNGLYETGKLNILGNKYQCVTALNMETFYVLTFSGILLVECRWIECQNHNNSSYFSLPSLSYELWTNFPLHLTLHHVLWKLLEMNFGIFGCDILI